jgi:hypothetical protein
MGNTDPKMDFRYKDAAGVEIEAYQVTKGARWDAEHWPPWLQTQGNAKDINKVYTDAADPNRLFISLDSGRFGLEHDAYVIFENGQLRVQSGGAFDEQFTKVVPVPDRILDDPSMPDFELLNKLEDGKIVPRTPEEIEAKRAEIAARPQEYVVVADAIPIPVENVIGSQSTLRPKVEIAYEMLLDDWDWADDSAGLKVLRQALADETDWCNCAPGQCTGGPRWGCRQNSPLVAK